jgi:hypothetical protein
MRIPLHRRAALFRALCFVSVITVAVLILGTRVLTIHDIQIIPTVSYLAALWLLRQSLRRDRGRTRLSLGRTARLALVGRRPGVRRRLCDLRRPLLKRALTETGPDKFFDPSSLLVVFVGAALIMLASLLADAAALEAELEQIL